MGEIKQYDFYYGAIINIYFLCKEKDGKSGMVAICTYEEFCEVQDKKTITIGKPKNKSYFNMHTEKKRETGIRLKTNRIVSRVEDIIKQAVDFSPVHYKKQDQIEIEFTSNKKEETDKYSNYKNIISGQAVRSLAINYGEERICPIHNLNMKAVFVYIARQSDTVYYCEKCGKFMVSPKHCQELKKMPKKRKMLVKFEEMEK